MFVTSEKGPVPKKCRVRIARTLQRKQALRPSLFAPSPQREGWSGHAPGALHTTGPEANPSKPDYKDKIRKYSFVNYSFATKVKMRTAVKKNNQLNQHLEWQQLLSLPRVTGKEVPVARTGPSSPWGCLTQQAEGIPKEVASASKRNISQAPAAFGKLLLGKGHMNHSVSSQ